MGLVGLLSHNYSTPRTVSAATKSTPGRISPIACFLSNRRFAACSLQRPDARIAQFILNRSFLFFVGGKLKRRLQLCGAPAALTLLPGVFALTRQRLNVLRILGEHFVIVRQSIIVFI